MVVNFLADAGIRRHPQRRPARLPSCQSRRHDLPMIAFCGLHIGNPEGPAARSSGRRASPSPLVRKPPPSRSPTSARRSLPTGGPAAWFDTFQAHRKPIKPEGQSPHRRPSCPGSSPAVPSRSTKPPRPAMPACKPTRKLTRRQFGKNRGTWPRSTKKLIKMSNPVPTPGPTRTLGYLGKLGNPLARVTSFGSNRCFHTPFTEGRNNARSHGNGSHIHSGILQPA